MVNKKTLYRNLKYVATSQVAVIPNCSILAAVGQKMASTPGVSATLFNALAKVTILVYQFLLRFIL
jgi:aspartokinase